MDGVRGLHFLPSINGMVSASEDCTLQVWDVKQFSKQSEIDPNIDPYLILRGHLSEIFALTGSSPSNSSDLPLVFSGGRCGTIKTWLVPQKS